MKKILTLFLAVTALAGCCQRNAGTVNYPELADVIEVAGRQGVATDGRYYYVSGSTALYKYDLSGRLVASNEHPFDALEAAANHIGDIDVYDGEIYAGIEKFIDGVGENIKAAIYSADDLSWKRSISWEPASGQVEVCGLAVDAARGKLYMSDWVNGRYLYRYDLKTATYEGKVQLRPVPALQQGIAVHGDEIIISCDDGDAENGECDRLYRADISDPGATSVDVDVFREMTDFRRVGEIEGLCFSPSGDSLIVLSNRGSRIILGMPSGFYEGYDHEIHELFIYTR